MSRLEINPSYRAALERQGLRCAQDFLALSGVIVGGHPDRHVMTVDLKGDLGRCFLKKEHRVRTKAKLRNYWAGLGWTSTSMREGRILRDLEEAGLGCPEVIACGESGGRAFLLLRALPGAVDFRDTWARHGSSQARASLAQWLGRELAKFIVHGFYHPDLYSKHLLVQETSQGPRLALVDWQRSRRRRRFSSKALIAMLAALDATLSRDAVSNRARLRCLRSLLIALGMLKSMARLARSIRRRSQGLLRKRRIRDMAQAPLVLGHQNLIWLDGEALCVTRQFHEEMGATPPTWLETPSTRSDAQVEQVPIAWGERSLSLVRRWSSDLPSRPFWGRKRSWFPAPEFAQAATLFRLERYRIPLPRLLAVGHRPVEPGGQYSFLLTEPQCGVSALRDFLQQETDVVQRRLVLRQAGVLLRRLHGAGYGFNPRQADPWQGWGVQQLETGEQQVVLVRVDGLEAWARPGTTLTQRDLKRALTTLPHRSDALRFFLGYWHATGLRGEARARWRRLRRAWSAPRQLHPCDRKGGRPLNRPDAPAPTSPRTGPASGSFWQRLLRGVKRCRQRGDWSSLAGADWSDRIMTLPVTDHFHAKQGRSTGRLVLENGGRRLVVYLKRHYRLPWWQGWLATLFPGGNWSPAMQECRNLDWAAAHGLPVPKVVAAGEAIGPWGRLQSFLAIEELTDMLPLHEAIPLAAELLPPWKFRRWKAGLIREVARLTQLLHAQRVFHQDLYLCHFYIHRRDFQTPADWRGRVHLIDLHRFGKKAFISSRFVIKDLGQLLFSSEVRGIEDRDRLRFWRCYLGAGRRSVATRLLGWWVRLKAKRYRCHNAKIDPVAYTPAPRRSA